jgi:tRNA(Ile)-lysidine synthase TilS/MesJ
MCKLCNSKPIYEFTNKRKLCKTCFLHYFQKKVLYTIRKFKMIENGDRIFYQKGDNFKSAVLKDVLRFVSDKSNITLVDSRKKADKIVIDSSIDSEAEDTMKILIKENASELKKFLPIQGNLIKPLYLFLDEEILLYARLKNLKFKQEKKKEDKIQTFENALEKKHPEVKRAIVNSVLELYKLDNN